MFSYFIRCSLVFKNLYAPVAAPEGGEELPYKSYLLKEAPGPSSQRTSAVLSQYLPIISTKCPKVDKTEIKCENILINELKKWPFNAVKSGYFYVFTT